MSGITSWRDFGSALVVFAIAVIFLLWTQTIPARATAMPTLVAWLTIVLALIDVVAQTETATGRLFRRFVSAEKVIEWKVQGDDEEAPWGRVLLSVAWVIAYLVGIYLAGFLLTTPLYVFLYMLLHGGKSLRAAGITAIATTFLVWLTFEIAFKYPLYPGVLFGGY
jgi:Tripartite tricarboxylate transporter TctB family